MDKQKPKPKPEPVEVADLSIKVTQLRCPYCHDDMTPGDSHNYACYNCFTWQHGACIDDMGECAICKCTWRTERSGLLIGMTPKRDRGKHLSENWTAEQWEAYEKAGEEMKEALKKVRRDELKKKLQLAALGIGGCVLISAGGLASGASLSEAWPIIQGLSLAAAVWVLIVFLG